MTAPVRRLKFKRANGASEIAELLPHTTNPTVREAIGNPSNMFDGVQVFSTTMMQQRQQLGDVVTGWIRSRPELEIVDIVVMQSSDSAFHCLSISVFYKQPLHAVTAT